jgi:hypothetical protein
VQEQEGLAKIMSAIPPGPERSGFSRRLE